MSTYRKEETKCFIRESYVDCWVVRSYKVDDHNEALKAMMCTQCHITPMRSYMFNIRSSAGCSVLVLSVLEPRTRHCVMCELRGKLFLCKFGMDTMSCCVRLSPKVTWSSAGLGVDCLIKVLCN